MMPRPLATRRAFTLIEVLMATFIIGLGMLGLAALFAGAARQQQVATQTTNATLQASNTDALIGRNLGLISGTNLAATGADRIASGVWYPIPTYNAGANAPQDDVLSIDAAMDGLRNGDLYFLAFEDQPAVLYDRASLPTGVQPVPQGTAIIRFDDPRVGQFPRTEVDCAGTAEIRAVFARNDDPTVRRSQTFVYVTPCQIVDSLAAIQQAPPPEWEVEASWASDCQNTANEPVIDPETAILERWSRGVFFLNGVVSTTNWIVVDRGTGNPARLPVPSRITNANLQFLQGNTDWQLERIDVPTGFAYRNDRVIALQDRILTRPDTASINGRRPDLGFALLYRRLDTGAGQLGVFTYQITPVDGQALRPEGFSAANPPRDLFIPFESLDDMDPSNNRAPLRRFDGVQLAYNNLDDFYYITIPGVNDDAGLQGNPAGALLSPGQLLLVQSRGLPNALLPGADDAVRVIRRTTVNGRPAGQLDRAPRSVGESMLQNINSTANINVWAIQQNVKTRNLTNRQQEGPLWKLEPLDFTVLQVE